MKHYKTSKQFFFVQKTPLGEQVLIYWEGDADVRWVFEDFARSQDPFTRWVKDQWLELTGVDFNRPSEGPPPEEIFTYGH